ncbi:hypothetical protein FRC11_004390 [Ceratobasidium sp. 423]|nr:hypothetical protein FRC11_004390 [Ceratobasidium sp. 423]
MLKPFLEIDSRNLSDLSINVEREEAQRNNLPDDFYHLFPLNDPQRESFDVLLNSLSVLRIRGVPIYWDQAVFSDRLVELHLQEITMGYDVSMLNLLNALSSAAELRCLKIIAVQTFRDPATDTLPQNDIVLPHLQSLFIQDLYSNTLALVLGSISSRSHRLTLSLTEKCVEIIEPGESEPEDINLEDLRELLESVSVSELLIDAESDQLVPWISASELKMLVRSVPDLETLRMNSWLFDEDYCKALRRPRNPPLDPQGRPYPSFKNLHISWGKILDEGAFRKMVSSHSTSLRRMDLGAAIPKLLPDGSLDWDTLEKSDELVVWAEHNVPNFLLINVDAPEFRLPEWELW